MASLKGAFKFAKVACTAPSFVVVAGSTAGAAFGATYGGQNGAIVGAFLGGFLTLMVITL